MNLQLREKDGETLVGLTMVREHLVSEAKVVYNYISSSLSHFSFLQGVLLIYFPCLQVADL